MKEQPYFPNTPLREAILEISVSPPSDLSINELRQIQSEVAQDYPELQEWTQYSVQGNFSSADVESSNIALGFQYSNSEKNQMFRTLVNGFIFIRLKPYDRWESFQKEAKKLWEMYRKIVKPKTITRLGLRYISELPLTQPFSDISEYLTIRPELTPRKPLPFGGLSSYTIHLELPQPDLGGMLVINQFLPTITEQTVNEITVVTDINVISIQGLPNPNADSDLWEFFERLRDRKNDAFLATINERMERQIGHDNINTSEISQ